MTGSSAEAPEAFSVRDAVATIDRATAYDMTLRRRTEGVTWMVWGFVTFAVAFAATLVDFDRMVWTYVFLIGFPALSIASAAAVWRIAGLTRPTLTPNAPGTLGAMLVAGAAFTLATALGWTLMHALGTDVPYPLMLVVLPWAVFVAAQWARMTDGGRRWTLYATAVMVLALGVFVQFFILPWEGNEAQNRAFLVAIVGGIPLAMGFARAFRE